MQVLLKLLLCVMCANIPLAASSHKAKSGVIMGGSHTRAWVYGDMICWENPCRKSILYMHIWKLEWICSTAGFRVLRFPSWGFCHMVWNSHCIPQHPQLTNDTNELEWAQQWAGIPKAIWSLYHLKGHSLKCKFSSDAYSWLDALLLRGVDGFLVLLPG